MGVFARAVLVTPSLLVAALLVAPLLPLLTSTSLVAPLLSSLSLLILPLLMSTLLVLAPPLLALLVLLSLLVSLSVLVLPLLVLVLPSLLGDLVHSVALAELAGVSASVPALLAGSPVPLTLGLFVAPASPSVPVATGLPLRAAVLVGSAGSLLVLPVVRLP